MKELLIRVGIGVGVGIAIIALVVCSASLKEVAYTVTVDYQDTETYYEDEPYETIETYYEDEPYVDTETYFEEVPLAYEIVESYTDTDSYEERRRIIIGGVVFQDEVVEVFYPIGCVTLQNTDSVDGTFEVQFAFYALEKLDAAMFGHPDFDFTDYLAAKDPDSFLDKLDWDELDWELIKIFCEEYNGHESLTLKPDETATVKSSAPEIDLDRDVWKWEYTITEPTKPVKRERNIVKYREVEKQRTIMEYRQIEKERTVWKERLETRYKKVTLFDYLLHY